MTERQVSAASMVSMQNIAFRFADSAHTCILDDAYFHGFGVEIRYRDDRGVSQVVKCGRSERP